MKNLNDAIQFLHGLDINSISSVDQSIPKQLLPELVKYLIEQRFNDKERTKMTQQQLQDIKIQLEQEKKNISKQEQYIVTLKEEIENLKYFINEKDQDNQKRYVMLSESSHSRIGELIQDLEKQKENTSQLRNLQKQMRQKCIHIKALQSSLAKSGEQIQFLKKFRLKNDALTKQINELKLKICQCQKSERNALLENEQLREKLSKVQEQNQQLQYIISNQISKVKQLTNEYFGSSKSNQKHQPGASEKLVEKINLKYQQKQQNANYLKKVEQSFINEYLMEIKPFQPNSIKNMRENKQQTNQKNDMEFQFSLEKASQNLNDKEIQSSSKSKGFNDYFMDINLNQSKNLCTRKQRSQNTVFCKQKMNDQDKDQQIFPLSMKKERKLDESQIKLFQMQKILERKVMEQKSFAEEQLEVISFSRDISRILQTKSKQIRNLNQKLERSVARNNEIEKELQQLDRSRTDQIKMFEEEIYSQIAKIERLNHELKQQNLKNVELSRKQQFYSNQISDLQKLCASYEIEALQNQKQIQKEKNAVSQLSRRLMEIEQQKWANLQTKNIFKIDCSVETIKVADRFNKTFASCIHIEAQKNQNEKSTNTVPLVNKKQYQISNLMTMGVKDCKSKIQLQLIKTLDLILRNKQKFQGKLNSKVCSISVNTSQQGMQNKTDEKVIKKYEQKEIQVDQEKELQQISENPKGIKQLWGESQKEDRGKIIKKFVPTSLQQQIIEQLQLRTSKRNGKNMRYSQIQLSQTLYFSVCEQNQLAFKKQQEQLKKQNIKQQKNCYQNNQKLVQKQKIDFSNQIKEVNQLLKIKQILEISSKMLSKFQMKTLPDISKLELKENKKKICDIITSFQDHKCSGEVKKKGKEFYLVSGLLEKDCQLTTDKILIWKEGIISLKLQKYLIMTNQKKFIHDPVNCILGNCQVIIHLHDEAIEVKRKEKKNYFVGNMQDCYWKVLEVDGAGYF